MLSEWKMGTHPVAGVDYRKRFRRWTSGSATTRLAGTIRRLCSTTRAAFCCIGSPSRPSPLHRHLTIPSPTPEIPTATNGRGNEEDTKFRKYSGDGRSPTRTPTSTRPNRTTPRPHRTHPNRSLNRPDPRGALAPPRTRPWTSPGTTPGPPAALAPDLAPTPLPAPRHGTALCAVHARAQADARPPQAWRAREEDPAGRRAGRVLRTPAVAAQAVQDAAHLARHHVVVRRDG